MKRESTITREHRAALVSVGQHAARGVGPQYTEARLAHGERHALGHRHATLSYPTTRPANHFPHADVTTHPPPVTVIVDTREHDVPAFDSWVRVERAGLGEGDFTTPLLWGTAVIERKNPDDFHKSFFSDDRERMDRVLGRFEELNYEWVCLVVEAPLSRFLGKGTHRRAVIGTVASLVARGCPPVFLDGPADTPQFIAATLRGWEKRMRAMLPRLTMIGHLHATAERLGLG